MHKSSKNGQRKETASYGKIKETTIGGFAISRKYSHIQEYEEKIIELHNPGGSLREIGDKLGFTYKQMSEFKTRYNKKQRKNSTKNKTDST